MTRGFIERAPEPTADVGTASLNLTLELVIGASNELLVWFPTAKF